MLKVDGSKIKVEVDVYDAIHDMLTSEQRSLLIQSLSCAEEVIEHVCSQLIEGYTEDGFCGKEYSSCGSALQKARQRIAENSDYATKKTIELLERRIQMLKPDFQYWQDAKSGLLNHEF